MKDTVVYFDACIQQGHIGEMIFEEDFLKFLGIKYVNVTGCQQFQVIDADYLAKIGLYEIKTNYKDDEHLVFEEYTNANPVFGPITLGWFYTTKADLVIFVSKVTRTMVFVPFTQEFKQHYEQIKENFPLKYNRVSFNRKTGDRWQSAFRRIPFEAIRGYYSIYRRVR